MASLFVEAKAIGIRSISAHAMSPYFIRMVQRFAGEDAVRVTQRNADSTKQGDWSGTSLDEAAEWIRSGYRDARDMSRNALEIDISVDLIPDELIDHAREIIRTGIIPKSGRSFEPEPLAGGAVVVERSGSSGTASIGGIVSKLEETITHMEAALASLDTAHDLTTEIEAQVTAMELAAQAGRAAMLMEQLSNLKQELQSIRQMGTAAIATADQIRRGNTS